jgi:hypothetical protein
MSSIPVRDEVSSMEVCDKVFKWYTVSWYYYPGYLGFHAKTKITSTI